MLPIAVHVNKAAQKAIERNNSNNNNGGGGFSSGSLATTTLPTLDQVIGAQCGNNGCTLICTDTTVAGTQCQYHRGVPTSKQIDFNNVGGGIQLRLPDQHWSCCERKANFVGCSSGKHRWIKRQRVDDNVRHDWFYRAGRVHLSIFCRSAVPQGTRACCDGLKLDITLAHGFGTVETRKQFELYSEVVPAESVLLISEKKVELVLKQVTREPWPRLCYEGPLLTGMAVAGASTDGASCEDNGEEEGGVFLVEGGDDDGICYVVT